MSSKKGVTRKTKKENVKVKLRKGRRVLEHKIELVESEITKLEEMEITLSEQKRDVINNIEYKVKALKDMIDMYRSKLCKSVADTHARNIVELHTLKNTLEQNLTKYRQDMEKCELSLKKHDGAKPLVSEKKVLQMMFDALDFSEFLQPNLQLTKTIFSTRKILDEDKQMQKLIGSVDTKSETLNEIKNKIEKMTSIECPMKEVTALCWSSLPGEECFWSCFGADKDLIAMSEDGSRLQYISVDYRLDDVTVLTDGSLLTTSPDSFCIKRIENFAGDGKKRAKTVFESDIYLHGLTLSLDGTMVVACGTDTPNYTKTKPKTTFIIEYALKVETHNRIALSGVTGKVYRIAQNGDQNYVLTFPKEGRVYSMTRLGEIHGYLSKSQLLKVTEESGASVFWPSGVCCNSKCSIIVCDCKGKKVLLLDSDCRFLRFIGDVYRHPNALAISCGTDKLLIGDEGRLEVWNV